MTAPDPAGPRNEPETWSAFFRSVGRIAWLELKVVGLRQYLRMRQKLRAAEDALRSAAVW
jgi:hypothetical protein